MDAQSLLAGKTAVVTGAGMKGGIGATSARALAEAGANVVLADLPARPSNEQDTGDSADFSLADVTSELTSAGLSATSYEFNLLEEESVRELIEFAVASYGSVDIIANNAAATRLVVEDMDVVSVTADVWDKTMAVNVRGAMFVCKYAIPKMLAGSGGSIINHSSVWASVGNVMQPAYSASKAALHALSQSIATTYGSRGIRCNTIRTGVIATPLMKSITPPDVEKIFTDQCLIPRLGDPQDIANLVVFLASPLSAYITGELIPCDGGFLAHVPMYSELMAAGR